MAKNKKMVVKWELVKEYERFNLYLNTITGCKECFWKDVEPNE